MSLLVLPPRSSGGAARSLVLGPLALVVTIIGVTYTLLAPAPGRSELSGSSASDAVRIVDVAGELRRDGKRDAAPSGGVALQLDVRSPAHVFRQDPSDRQHLWSTTPGFDFFLEDPVRPASSRPLYGPHRVTVGPQPPGVRTVSYFVDGDLWIDTHHARSVLVEGADRVELVVLGDVHIADDVLTAPGTEVAIYALRDPARPGSGNIHLEDRTFGSLSLVRADLFAEGAVLQPGAAACVVIDGVVAQGR